MNRRTAGRGAGWEATALRIMGRVTGPALAGAAFTILCLGVVTWLPAWAAAARSLHRWRSEADDRCFVNVFTAFPGYRRRLLLHSCVATAAGAVLVANVVFLAGRQGPAALVLLAVQVGIAPVVLVYHLGLAVTAGLDPDGDAAGWRRSAMALAFASPRRGLLLAVTAVGAPVLTLPVPFGPVLLGPTLPLLAGLAAAGAMRTAKPVRH